jgi:hypothetical protein
MIETKNFLINPDELDDKIKHAKLVTRREKLAEQ